MAMNSIIAEEADLAGVNLADIFPISGALYENAGAYSAACRTHFNGLYSDDWAIIE